MPSRLRFGAGATNADAALATADRLCGDGHYAEAADAYELAIAHAPANWPSYGRSMESLLYSLSSVDSSERVALIARDAYPRVAGTPSAPSVAASGLGETLELPADYPQRRELIAIHEARLKESLADPDVRIADDDRSSYMASLMDARKDAGDSTGARKAAEAWSRSSTAPPRGRRRRISVSCSTRIGCPRISSWVSRSARSRCSSNRSATSPTTTIRPRVSRSPTHAMEAMGRCDRLH